MPKPIANLTALAALILLAGCASTQAPKPAVCDGKHRRPANAYGTVLPDAPLPPTGGPPSPAVTPPAAPPAGPAPEGPGPLSAIDPRSFEPCGRGA